MKTNRYLAALTAFLLFTATGLIKAQDQPYITVTTMHWNMDKEDFSMDKWMEMEKEYRDKVINKNDLIKATAVYQHLYTPDSRELVFVTMYDNWNDIDLAQKKNNELVQTAWPDEASRKAFMQELNSNYDDFHSDEIYAMLPGAKFLSAAPTEDMVLYVRVNHMAYPEDGSQKEFMEMHNWFTENLVKKNDYVKAYYPHMHAWGADRREMVDAWLYASMADLDKATENQEKLFEEAMPDEAERRAWNQKGRKYFTGVHKDYLYSYLHELSKPLQSTTEEGK
ncbi:hypothetical protein [Robertkochia aurantiaca]|uniref:hypothetical protein n=1 Tax=Robertkochia aurantiaca TaxID=2873700 RepID=UPI001CCF7874|nr:hypothetical protein [Robertkochia sp. 3YJGBD-33]